MTSALDILPVSPDTLGESPLWIEEEDTLYWVDIKNPRIRSFQFNTQMEQNWEMPSEPGGIFRWRGGLGVALRDGVFEFSPEWGLGDRVAHPEAARPDFRLNEAKTDPSGRLWVGSAQDPGMAEQGRLFCVEPEGQVHEVLRGLKMPNAIGWTQDGALMTFADSFTRRLDFYAFDTEAADLSQPVRSLDLSDHMGLPDGIACDADGLWLSFIDGWAVVRLSYDGAVLSKIDVPVQRPTGVTRFDRQGQAYLAVASASFRVPPEDLAAQPLAGRMFIIPLAGLPE